MITRFRRSFVLVVPALALAGALQGQVVCPSAVQPANPAGNLLRVEGTTEEVADVNIYCAASSTLGLGTLRAALNAQVTSQAVGAATDAALLITPTDGALPTPSPTGPPVAYFGFIQATATGLAENQGIEFDNVSFPAGAFSVSVRNVRVNASLLPLQYSVNELVQVFSQGTAVFTQSAPQLVGIVLQGLAATTVTGVNNYTVCQGSPGFVTPSGNITVIENFSGAFKSRTPTGANGLQFCSTQTCPVTNGEQGTYTPGGAVGNATHGTRVQLAFAGLNPMVTVTVPLTVTNGTLTMALTTNAAGAFIAPATGDLATTAAGTAFGWYEVMQTDNTQPPASITIPYTVNAPPNFAQTAVAAFTVSVTFAPQGTLMNTVDVPNFTNATTTAPLALSSYAFCQSPQTISFPSLPNLTYPAAPFALSATASSGLAVTFRTDTPGVCTVSGQTATIVAAGACSITADQTGNVNFFEAPSMVGSFVVGKGSQTITFGPLVNMVSGAPPFTVSAVASSGLPVGFSSTTPTVCSVLGATVTLASAGTCSIVANQAGNTNYFAAPAVTQSFTFSPGVQPLTLNCSPATGPTQSGIAYSAACSATGGKLPYAFAVGTGALPPGLTLDPNTGAVAGTPGAGGAYSYSIQVQDAENPPQTASQSYHGKIASPITVSPALVSFTYRVGDAAPAAQTVSIFSTPSGTAFSAAVSSGSWLSILFPVSVSTPGTFAVAVNIATLTTPGALNGAITITTAGAIPVIVPVTVTVLPQAAPQLSATPSSGSFTLAAGASAGGVITVSNAGTGTLQFTASSDQPGWLTTLSGGSATFATPGLLGFQINTQGLQAGLHTGHITIASASGGAQVTISLVVSAAADSLQLSETSLNFTADTNGPLPPGQTLAVAEPGANWTAQVQTITGGDWLRVTSSGGAATVAIVQTNLAPGEYYGNVAITAPGASNSPQTVSVLLTINPAGTEAGGIVLSTGGLILTGPARGGTVTGHVSIFNPSATPGSFSTTTSVSGLGGGRLGDIVGGGWLTTGPPGVLAPGSNDLAIQANLASLTAGVYAGAVTMAFDDGSARVIDVTLVATNAPEQPLAAAQPRLNFICPVAGALVPSFMQPANLDTLQVAVSQPVVVQIVDSCGNAVAGIDAEVTFGNGDPALNLTEVGGGIWEGTWTPTNAGAQVTLQVAAQRSTSPESGTASLMVAVNAASASGAAEVQGVVNAAGGSAATPQIVSPGSFAAIYGILLASGAGTSAATVPLPINMGDTKLLLGGQALPLSYTSGGQVNALIPQGLNPNAAYSLVVQRGTTQSAPLPVTVVALQPGIYTVNQTGTGQGIVQIAGTSLLAAPSGIGARPVQSGTEFLQIYATGLGTVVGTKGEPAPADGNAASLPTVYKTAATVTATLGGVSVPVTFSGLTPTLVGLYQVNVQVPAGVPVGSAVPLVITATSADGLTVAQSNTVTVAVQ